ncbi:SDR family oxidoreductase [Sphingomonas sp. LaA6.9]|uniref:SDR family oxidoreductase n=1 Tax=Sphingomonas sp. LaA6.9 TaxID=2919914 RepID=UPI001F4FD99A|nr:SDR family oxidoreductase [Sphingomonas sp. LaA6.9]MCJ8156561.1 SDR family oxidoreductase [Sphingomonas sp. LaA6.9]
MCNVRDKVVLITGASSGIGEATAKHLARRGAHVVLGARRESRLQSLVDTIWSDSGSARWRALDVTDLASMQAFVDFALAEFGRIDAVVNNAGLMPLSPFDALRIDEWNCMIDVNIRGVLHGIAAALPVMKRQGFGQFVNIASIAGHRVIPAGGVYSATKYAVRAISEGLRLENRDIRVSIISPGPVESELGQTITHEETARKVDDLRKMAISPDSIARATAFAIEQPEDVDISEILVRPTISTM